MLNKFFKSSEISILEKEIKKMEEDQVYYKNLGKTKKQALSLPQAGNMLRERTKTRGGNVSMGKDLEVLLRWH